MPTAAQQQHATIHLGFTAKQLVYKRMVAAAEQHLSRAVILSVGSLGSDIAQYSSIQVAPGVVHVHVDTAVMFSLHSVTLITHIVCLPVRSLRRPSFQRARVL